MAAGIIYTEIDLDSRKFDATQKRILYDAKTMAINVEDSWKVLGQKSDVMYNAMRQQAINAYEGIKSRATSSAAEIVRAEEAKNAKIKALNEQQFGAQISFLDSLKKNWIAVSAAVIATYYATEKMYNFIRSIASAGNDIQRMSRVFNMATDDFQKWSYVARMADVDIEGFGQGFKFLTRSMSEALQGSGDAAKAFNLLGINLKDTTGKTKDQQTIMMETIGTLEKYADGVDRDALMLAIFGRGWMSIKPLVDQGTKAIEENRLEAERLNLVLGKDVIKSLSESGNAFKRWESTFKVARLETFAPMVEILGSMLERVMALKRAWGESGIMGIYKEIIAGQEKARIEHLPAAAWTKEWVAGWTPPIAKPKPQAPGLPGKAEYPEWRSIMGEERIQGEKEYWEAQHKTWEIENKIIAIEGDRAQQLADDMFPSMDKVTKIQEQMTEGAEKLRVKLVEVQILVGDFGWEDYASGALEASSAGERAMNKMAIANEAAAAQAIKAQEIWDSIGRDTMSVLSSNMVNLMSATESWGEKFRKVGESIIQTLMQIIVRQMLMNSLFESSEGGGKGFLGKGSGIGGLFTTAVGWFGAEGGITPDLLARYPLHSYAMGGIATSPQIGIFGEGGGSGEAFVPLKNGKIPVEGGGGGGITVYQYVQVLDPNTFNKVYGGVMKNITENTIAEGKRYSKRGMR
jgi:hypothetical protein